MGSGLRTVELIIPGKLWTVNAERAGHWRVHRAKTKLWREAAAWVAKRDRVPVFARCEVLALPGQARGRLADAGAHLPAVKACVDGLVDAGVLADDGPGVVSRVVLSAPVRVRSDCVRLTLTGIVA